MKKIVVVFLFFLLCSSSLQAQAPFYQDKTIRIALGFSSGGISDLWGRALFRAMGNHTPGNPNIIIQNMPGAGSMVAANYVYSIAKPDGLTLGFITPGLYFNQLIGLKEVQFDWAKFIWIGSPERTERIIYFRSDSPYKTVEDIRKASEPPRCGATAIGTVGHYFPKLLEEALGLKFNIVAGYPGAADIDLALEKGEVHCRAGSVQGYFGSEPTRTWANKGFVRVLVQGGTKRDPRLPDVPTIYELIEKRKTPEAIRRLATVLLSPDDIGRPIVGTPGIPADRTKILREALMKALSDPEFLAEAKKRGWEVNPVSGEELETIARKVIVQPPDVIDRMRKILGN